MMALWSFQNRSCLELSGYVWELSKSFGALVKYYDLERYDEALESFDKVLEVYPFDVTSLNNKAFVLKKLGR
jgi:tetratricopeptide (TPR) repeat protein